mmetsp:Transcript_6668/g.16170  ORF Transcript_6668/g.16170 Transcript_6668/m.16170 type:complete len:243 (-) Transcript_6668:207-935(-)
MKRSIPDSMEKWFFRSPFVKSPVQIVSFATGIWSVGTLGVPSSSSPWYSGAPMALLNTTDDRDVNSALGSRALGSSSRSENDVRREYTLGRPTIAGSSAGVVRGIGIPRRQLSVRRSPPPSTFPCDSPTSPLSDPVASTSTEGSTATKGRSCACTTTRAIGRPFAPPPPGMSRAGMRSTSARTLLKSPESRIASHHSSRHRNGSPRRTPITRSIFLALVLAFAGTITPPLPSSPSLYPYVMR